MEEEEKEKEEKEKEEKEEKEEEEEEDREEEKEGEERAMGGWCSFCQSSPRCKNSLVRFLLSNIIPFQLKKSTLLSSCILAL